MPTKPIYQATLMQKLLGRNYKFDKLDWLLTFLVISFYIIWTFRAFYGYKILNLPTTDCPSCQLDSDIYWGATKILWIPISFLFTWLYFKKNIFAVLGLKKLTRNSVKWLFIGVITLFVGLLAVHYDNASWFLNIQLPQYSLFDWFSWLIIIAFGEELFFRGFLFGWLIQKFKPIVAITITSFLFSLVHYCWWYFAGKATLEDGVYVFIVGLALTFFRYKSDNVYVSTIGHFLHNLLII